MIITDALAKLARIGFFICLVSVLLLAWLPIHDVGAPSDSVNHAFAFFVLCGLAGTGWMQAPKWRLFAGLLFLGGLIEVVQSFVGRDAAWHDVGADLVGIAAGLFVLLLLRLRPRPMRLPD
jgi:VanZ family protein